MTQAKFIDGRRIAADFLTQIQTRVDRCRERGIRPCLAVILVGDDPASQIYVRNKQKQAERLGIATQERILPVAITDVELHHHIDTLNADSAVDGILLQLPLPTHLDTERAVERLDPSKDVDGFTSVNMGLLVAGRPNFIPCTPQGCMRLLAETQVQVAGKHAVIVGRSRLVGKPLIHLLLQENATVTIAHSKTKNLASIVAQAEILIVAVGKVNCIPGAWIRPGAVVLDVGINRLANGKLSGDVEFAEAHLRAGAITPVPGGVGPMTIACLMHNCVLAAERRGQ